MAIASLWELGLAGQDSLAAAAVERFCLALGSVAGDFALGHGASAVVIAGGLGYRLRDYLAHFRLCRTLPPSRAATNR